MGPQHTARDEKMLRSQTPAQASKSSFRAILRSHRWRSGSCRPPLLCAMRRMTRHVKDRPPAPGGYGPALWR